MERNRQQLLDSSSLLSPPVVRRQERSESSTKSIVSSDPLALSTVMLVMILPEYCIGRSRDMRGEREERRGEEGEGRDGGIT